MTVQRGEIFLANLDPVIGSEQGGTRYVVVLQNDKGNMHSNTTIVAAMTSRTKKRLPTHVEVIVNGVQNVVLLEQIRTLSSDRFISPVGVMSEQDMRAIEQAVKCSLAI